MGTLRQKLWALNLALLAIAALAGYRVRQEWKEARAREEATLNRKPKPVKALPFTPPPAVGPVRADGYMEVAQNMLFSKDRNPNVVVAAAPPKPQPPYPKLYGVMNFGDGPTAILSEGPNRPQRGFQPGEHVGDYKLLSASPEELVFEWDGQKFAKKASELIDRSPQGPAADATPRAAAAPPATAPPINVRAGPGPTMGGGYSACAAGDSSPAGTVVDGMKKVVTETPFSKICRWEPTK